MTTMPPTPGSSRDDRARLVGVWLLTNTGPMAKKRKQYTYQGVANAIELTKKEVQQAVYDLRNHYNMDPMIVSVPCYQNNFSVEVNWRLPAKQGMVNRLRDEATRIESKAVLMERAADEETDPSMAFLFRSEAQQARASAIHDREMVTMLQRAGF